MNKMSVATLFVFVIAVVHVKAEFPEELMEAKDKCVIELELKADLYRNIPGMDDDENEELTHDAKCLVRCMYRGLGLMTVEDKMSEEFIKEVLPGTTPDAIEVCHKKVASDCDGAYEMIRCFSALVPKLNEK